MPRIPRKAQQRLVSQITIPEVAHHPDAATSSTFTNPLRIPQLKAQVDPALVDVTQIHRRRLPRGHAKIKPALRLDPNLVLADGRGYRRDPHLPLSWARHEGLVESHDIDFFGLHSHTGLQHEEQHVAHPLPPRASRYQCKKANQWRTWSQEVIPALVEPYLALKQCTSNMRHSTTVPATVQCSCGQSSVTITVLCVYWQELREISVALCVCTPVPTLLIQWGLFPAAPSRPSLAVDMNMLEFVSELSMHGVPNNMAWCETLNNCLTRRGYNLASNDSLRRRFGHANHWYTVLVNATQKYIDILILRGHCDADTDKYPQSSSPTPAPDSPDSCSTPDTRAPEDLQSPTQSTDIRPRADTAQSPVLPPTPHATFLDSSDIPPELLPLGRPDRSPGASYEHLKTHPVIVPPSPPKSLPHATSPPTLLGFNFGHEPSFFAPDGQCASQYLRSRCPCCFGAAFPENILPEIPNVIALLDANFGQKRQHVGADPPFTHPYTHFVSEDEVHAMEEHVEALRPSRKQAPDKRKHPSTSVEDAMEPTGLPTSVLNACEKTFEAADSRRQKASTKFFDDTGTMALLCRHDHVLFMVNMKSTGEKQFYVFALINALMKQLPPTILLGMLYDIGCQSDRSVHKWGFLPEYHDRIIWALSVFHAYGHKWPCQMVYSLCKRVGFGESDGEGCERLWSALKELIPNLRVSGHFRRIYILDEKIEYLHHQALARVGTWLTRAYTHAENKKVDNQHILDTLSVDLDTLRQEWAAQLTAQTKPLPSQAQNCAKKVIERIVRLQTELDTKNIELDTLQKRHLATLDTESPEDDAAELEVMIEDLKAHRLRVLDTITKLSNALGVTEQAELKKLLKNEYLTLRMNMRAKKQQIRERIRRRKFELTRVERSHRHSVNECKVVDHSEQMITRREPTISRLVTEYNKSCDKIADMIRLNKVPQGVQAIMPQKIDPKKIFTLDVDDNIWQDIGLEDDTAGIPRWLGDEDVRAGIRAMLEVDRAKEEMKRLKDECSNLRTWTRHEWQAINGALEHFENSYPGAPIVFALQERRERILDLGNSWHCAVRCLPIDQSGATSWGPPDDMIGPEEDARHLRATRHSKANLHVNIEYALVNNNHDDSTLEETEDDKTVSESDRSGSPEGDISKEPGLVEALEAIELSESMLTEREWQENELREGDYIYDDTDGTDLRLDNYGDKRRRIEWE